MIEDRSAAHVLAALGLTIDATDQEIEAAARRLDPEAVEGAEDSIREIIREARASR
ncbi:hypothetical protein [Methylobacterium sp. WL18]|uniref:hypothetical protein n=1 Tax=Methylobacterium sp. WL18 TaxID=2603897 RepID=UPI00164EDE72|nr:hypothetical protein [Methylobacterium sp. WL18]